MTLRLDHKGNNIINWQPTHKQWCITGFDYKTSNAKRDDLTATFSVTFNNTTMYNGFYNEYNSNPEWNFDGYMASFTF